MVLKIYTYIIISNFIFLKLLPLNHPCLSTFPKNPHLVFTFIPFLIIFFLLIIFEIFLSFFFAFVLDSYPSSYVRVGALLIFGVSKFGVSNFDFDGC